MVGYYDTDMLNIVLPTFLFWSLTSALRLKENKYILFTALEIIVYRWWYPQSYSLEFAFFGLIALFVLYLFIKKEDVKYELFLLSFMLFAMMGLDDLVRLSIVGVLFVALHKGLLEKFGIYLLAIALGMFFFSGGFNPIWLKLKAYVFQDALLSTKGVLELHYYSVMQTVREAGKIPFELFASRISGHPITFILAFVGYVWMAYRYRVLLLGLPLIGLGFLAYVGGLRFTVYAVPVLGLGIAFLIVQLASLTNTNLKKNIFIFLLTLLTIAPNIEHIVGYKVSSVFSKPEVEVLENIKNIAQREDYVVGWWDYGYPIRYYADVKTLTDGGKHNGAVNFATSFALTHSQDVAAKMLRLDVEYTEKSFVLDNNISRQNQTNMANMTLDYGFNDTNDFLRALQTPLVLPEKTRDIYLYLPARMMPIYPTVSLFSNRDLMSGLEGHQPFFFVSQTFQDNGASIELGQGVRINKQSGYVEIGKQQIALKSFINTYYTPDGKLQVDKSEVRYNGEAYAVYMRDYRQFVIVDKDVYNSTYFQLFVLENYDANLYEPTMLTPNVKVYKLKI
jgi:dolichyl-diphosphooligosaccharide--protein glycosyltransferase/undecaprenyl-diphosphooligosaccharide--protein glycosyltransferase